MQDMLVRLLVLQPLLLCYRCLFEQLGFGCVFPLVKLQRH